MIQIETRLTMRRFSLLDKCLVFCLRTFIFLFRGRYIPKCFLLYNIIMRCAVPVTESIFFLFLKRNIEISVKTSL